jgi:CheY-like chemotaxis protein
MGGSIELSSRLGEGTKVTLELRLPVAQREVERPAELAGRHAIVRLASVDTANALAAHLTTLGLTVEQIPPTQPMRRGAAANLLFIDQHDQHSAAMIAAQPVLVDASANGISGPRDERLWLNTNPLKWQAVARVCAQTLKPSSASRDVAAPVATTPIDTPPATGRILVAEDHPISQSLIRRQLGLLGWDCDVVGDGQAALAALRQGDYAMLLTDCQMPLMNGYELAAAWRQHESSTQRARLPVIAMTANALDGEIERCFEAGMDDYLSKPVQLRPLEDKLRTWAPRVAVAPKPEAGLFDDVFAEPGMEDLRAEMLQAMLKTSGPDLAKLEQAMAQGDGAQAQRTLHRMLGALQLFTNGPVIADGRELMAALGDEPAEDAWRQLPGYLESLRATLSGLAP